MDIFPDINRHRVRKAAADRLAGVVNSERYSVQARHNDGTVFPVTIHGSLTRYKGRAAIFGTMIKTKKIGTWQRKSAAGTAG
jgi:hypothetical protein